MNPILFVWFALLLGVVWFTFVRPRREAARRASALSSSLEVGEEVITIGGLYGTIASIDDRIVELEVADGVTLTFARRAIAGRAPSDELEDDGELEEDDLEDDGELGHADEIDDNFEVDDASDQERVIERAPKADESSGR
jgi:preprotein translocase subunit YajC